MTNFEMATIYGIKMAEMTVPGGQIYLGLIGSGLKGNHIRKLFSEIYKQVPVKFITSEDEVVLHMERL